MSNKFESEPKVKIFTIFAALSAAGILEMSGGADPQAKEFVIASYGFAVALPMSIAGYLMELALLARKDVGVTQTRMEKIQADVFLRAALGGVSTGVGAILSHFMSQTGVSIFFMLSVASGFFVYKSMVVTVEAQEKYKVEIEVQLQRVKEGQEKPEGRNEQSDAKLARLQTEADEWIRIRIREEHARSKRQNDRPFNS